MKRVAAVIAAAGSSRRYGAASKLHALLDGTPLLAHVLRTLSQVPLAARLVVTAPDDRITLELLTATACAHTVNPDPAAGIGASIACGIRGLPGGIDGAFIALGDMPFTTVDTYGLLLRAFEELPADAIVAPVCAERRGHPVLFGAAHFPALAQLTGDIGARALLRAARVVEVVVEDPGVLTDIDTPEELAAARRGGVG
jgi:molybdenum cofactor cytidylyltransferase